jgi:hypothetical protein
VPEWISLYSRENWILRATSLRLLRRPAFQLVKMLCTYLQIQVVLHHRTRRYVSKGRLSVRSVKMNLTHEQYETNETPIEVSTHSLLVMRCTFHFFFLLF